MPEHVFVYGQDEIDDVVALKGRGLSQRAISRLMGIDRHTIARWLANPPDRSRATDPVAVLPEGSPTSYAYLLGIYLGDGWIGKVGRTYRLRISLDRRYPDIIGAAGDAIREVLPGHSVSVRRHPKWNLDDVICYSINLPLLFPQHGKGRKHMRRIRLADWQRQITGAHPQELLRGLIHSDGCRFVANQPRGGRIYSYPRYCFRNYSRDIIAIFCEHLDQLGLRWTLSSPNQIQIARRESVAALDEFIGPKR